MKQILLVFLGGGLGSVLRFLINIYFQKLHSFPIGTLLVNVVGSFIIGYILSVYSIDRNHWSKFIFVVGFCGGFTTFSTFSVDIINMLKQQLYLSTALYASLSLVLSLGATLAGLYLPRLLGALKLN